jgi:hypothetical protein
MARSISWVTYLKGCRNADSGIAFHECTTAAKLIYLSANLGRSSPEEVYGEDWLFERPN